MVEQTHTQKAHKCPLGICLIHLVWLNKFKLRHKQTQFEAKNRTETYRNYSIQVNYHKLRQHVDGLAERSLASYLHTEALIDV